MKNINIQYRFILLPGLDGTGDTYTWLKQEMLSSGVLEENIMIFPYGDFHKYENIANNIRGFIITSDLPVVMIAESFAGPLALSLASENPTKVKKLILSATFGVRPVCTFIPKLSLDLFNLVPISLVPIKKFPHSLLNSVLMNFDGFEELKVVMEDIYNNSKQRVLDKRVKQVVSLPSEWSEQWPTLIETETLILKPKNDRLIDKSNSDILNLNLINSTLIEMKAPHMLLQTHAPEAWEHIADFINR